MIGKRLQHGETRGLSCDRRRSPESAMTSEGGVFFVDKGALQREIDKVR